MYFKINIFTILYQDYIHAHKQTNIVCEFIVGAKGIFKNDSKEMMYKKLQNNDIIKKYYILYNAFKSCNNIILFKF